MATRGRLPTRLTLQPSVDSDFSMWGSCALVRVWEELHLDRFVSFSIDAKGAIRRAQLSGTIPTFPELLKGRRGLHARGVYWRGRVFGVSGLGRGFDLCYKGPDFSGFNVTISPAVEWLRT